MPDSSAAAVADTASVSDPSALRRALAADLLSIEAVLLRPDDPFTWSSGLKAPIYCDNRLALGHPPVRRRIAEGFAALLEEKDLAPAVIAGTATAGIPHAAWLAARLELPMVYVRSSAKAHGRTRRVEGGAVEGRCVVLVEDLVSTGQSSAEAVEGLREAGAEVAAVLAIFSYGLDASAQRFAAAGVPLYTLTDLEALLEEAEAQGALGAAQREALDDWQRDPKGWSSQR